MKSAFLGLCLSLGSVAFAYDGYLAQQQDFLKDVLPKVVNEYSSSLNADLKIVEGSVRLKNPSITNTFLGVTSILGNQYCTQVDFQLTDSKNVFSSSIYLFIQENKDEKDRSVVYSKLYPGNLRIAMTAGCIGLNQIREPVLDLKVVN